MAEQPERDSAPPPEATDTGARPAPGPVASPPTPPATDPAAEPAPPMSEPAAPAGAAAESPTAPPAGGGSPPDGPPGDGPPPADAGDGGEPPDEPPDPAVLARQKKLRRLRRRARIYAENAGKALAVIIIFTVVIFFDRIVHSIYPGQMGVHWSRFFGGTVLDKVYTEGMKLVWPWDEFYIYDMREQELEQTTVIYAKDGLEISVKTSVRFRPTERYLPRLHQEVGPDYVDKVVRPEVVSTLRTVLGNYTPEMIYAKDEQGLIDTLGRQLRLNLDYETFEVTEFLVTELRLPETIETAIKQKLTEEQRMLSYRFRLETEKDEKERRVIEAEGIRAFEAISKVPILKWRGIEATENLAQSPNTKVVLMGTGDGQLPIILNADAPAAPPAAAPSAPPSNPPTSAGFGLVPSPDIPLPGIPGSTIPEPAIPGAAIPTAGAPPSPAPGPERAEPVDPEQGAAAEPQGSQAPVDPATDAVNPEPKP